ncbi:MAG: hypothetical protein WCG85_18745, partial [Polyangia bacterium]
MESIVKTVSEAFPPALAFAGTNVTPYQSLAKSWHALVAHFGKAPSWLAAVTNIFIRFQYALATLRALLPASTGLKLLSRN